MIAEFLKSRVGVILLSIIWGLGLATLFKKSCEGRNCHVIEYRGPISKETSGVWSADMKGNKCYKLKSYLVDCSESKKNNS